VDTVLYIEDNAGSPLLVERFFERGPDVDGAAVLAMLRADPLTRSIPLVILRADAIDRKIQTLLTAGAVGHDSPLAKRL
jgi:hypothetical protein